MSNTHLRDALAEDIALMLTFRKCDSNFKLDTSKRKAEVYLTEFIPTHRPEPDMVGVALGGNCYLTDFKRGKEVFHQEPVEYSYSERADVDKTGRFPNSIQKVAEKILDAAFGSWSRVRKIETELQEVLTDRLNLEWKYTAYRNRMIKQSKRRSMRARRYYQRCQFDQRVYMLIALIVGLVVGYFAR